MTRMLSILTLFASLSAVADERTIGSSTLTLWFDRGADIASIEIDELSDRSVRGRSSFGNGLLKLEREGDTLKGFADGGFVDLTCSQTECSGIVGSDTTRATATQDGDTWEVRGSMNHVYIHARITPTQIEIHADGSLVLKKDKKRPGVWNGYGYLDSIESRFTARMTADGSLRNSEDLGLFLVYLVSPLVRD